MSGAAEHYAKIPRKVVLHRIATAKCLKDRLFWGIILWSWCGPERTEDGRVVLKDEKGYICRDHNGKEKLAKAKNLRELLGLAEEMKGNVSRAIQELVAQNSIHIEDGIVYANGSPNIPENPKKVVSTDNFYVGSRRISTDNLPTDPDARERAVQWLENANTSFNLELKELRTKYARLLEHAAPGLGIIIEEEKKSREEEETSSSLEEATTTTKYAPEPEEEPSEEPEPEEPPAEEPENEPPTPDAAATFHARIKTLFQEAGKPVPLPAQSQAVWSQLNGDADGFLGWLGREKLRRVRHPGVLPSLVVEFKEWKSAQPQPPPPKLQQTAAICPKCADTGFIDRFDWPSLPAATAHAAEGAQICDCAAGVRTRALVNSS